ncbi:Ger(x)C family spore germination C-terminal domain-containing protein, partial [Bacteroidales bacterium MSK.15.36]|nr:Ger(x)C family spore germination C-terminal domain-containing protein [Bacteroidales bacterium MSK.15.36]
EYKIDLLELGRIAAAKYGRRTGVDWDEVVSDSEIDIKVNSKIVTTGKGNFKH